MSINDLVDDLDSVATAAAFKAGAVSPCSRHPEVTIYHGDSDADRHAYALATNAWKAGHTVFDREDVMEAVKDVFDLAADGECPECAHQILND